MYTVSPLFDHYPAFVFAKFEDGSNDLWIASAHTVSEFENHPESLGAKVTREHMQACRSYWRRNGHNVKAILVPKSEVTFKRSNQVPLSPKVDQ
jgi:hypothetical protein